jgi:nucleoside-diphosphate-sugar epimerase
MRVLIVGAAGSLGRLLAPELAARGHEVIGFDLQRLESSPARWIQGDARQAHQVLEAAAGCEAVVHIAAWHGIHLRERTMREFWELNVDAAFNVFQAARTVGARKVLFCSAMGVYGGLPRSPDRALRVTDESPLFPAKDIYAYTKIVCEQLCELYHRVYGLDVIAFRLGMFVPCDFMHYGMRLLHGGVDERDLAQAFRLALENDALRSGSFNLFSPTPFEEEDEADLVASPPAVVRKYYPDAAVLDGAARGRELQPHWYTMTPEGGIVPSPIRVYWKCERAREQLGWQPEYDFARFLRDLGDGTADYVQANRYPVPGAPRG